MSLRIAPSIIMFALLIAGAMLGGPFAYAQTLGTFAPMMNARTLHTSTLLPDGLILVAGGNGASGATLTSAELYNPATHAWSSAGNMTYARANHTATLLPSGQVLVVGGIASSTALSTAELYSPVTNSWSTVGPLSAARYGHTATLLSNGTVLVTGGNGLTSTLASAEIFNPSTAAWTGTGPLATARVWHTATLLPGGQVVVAGGQGSSGGALASAEMFNGSTWSTLAHGLMTARYSHSATLLPSGQVLFTGGQGASGALGTAELFAPSTTTWAYTGSLTNARSMHVATLLPNGQVLCVGGEGSVGLLASAELYDPSKGMWSSAGALVTARQAHTASLLSSGRVLITGGLGGAGALSSTEYFDPAGNSWSSLQSGPANYWDTATLLPTGQVLVAGGYNQGSIVPSDVLYTPSSNTWSNTATPNVPVFLHTATLLPNGQVLIAGGQNFSFSPIYLSATQIFNPTADSWAAGGNLANGRSSHTATLLPTGQVLAVGGFGPIPNGNGAVGALTSAERYSFTTNTWSSAGNLTTARNSHSATLLSNGMVLVAGGEGIAGTALASAELYDPSSNSWSAAGPLMNARLGHTATLLPSGQVLVVGGYGPIPNGNGITGELASAEIYTPSTNTWSSAGNMVTARTQHTATLLPRGTVLVAGGLDSVTTLASAEMYDPSSNSWSSAGSLAVARYGHSATLMATGQVLFAGGVNYTTGASVASTEAYQINLGFLSAWQPQVSNAPAFIVPGSELTLSGAGFTGISEASGGNGTQNSPSNYPLVMLERLDNHLQVWPGTDPTTSISSSSVTTGAVSGIAGGEALLTVFVNGIPGPASLVLVEGSQTISFGALANQALGSAPFAVTATATSGLPVQFSSMTPSVCTVLGNMVTLVAGGSCTIAADQAGNGAIAAAPEVTQTFTVLINQTINLPAIANQAVSAGLFQVSAADNSGVPVSFSSLTPSVCTVSGNTVTMLTTGECTIAADAPANNTYAAAAEVTTSFTILPQGTIVTYAGDGAAGYSGDGGPATTAMLSQPGGLAIDASGALDVADESNQTVRWVLTSGPIFTLTGNGTAGFSGDGGPATLAQINSPRGLTVDGAGNRYIADSANNRIRMVAESGLISTIAGNGIATFAGDGGPATSASLNSPRGLAFDGGGNLYISDYANQRIRKVTPSGVISTFVGNGTPGFGGDGGPAAAAALNGPRGLAFDGNGNLYVADSNNNRIRMITPAGMISTVAGNGSAAYSGDGGAATSAGFAPHWVAVDGNGNLYISDYTNNRVRMVSAGVITTVAGTGVASYSGDGGLATAATLNEPGGLVFDANGNLFIADSINHVVREVYGLGPRTNGPNTPIGSTVTVTPPDSTSGLQNVAAITFGAVTSPGLTTVTTGISAPATPTLSANCTPAVAISVVTTASFSGNATVCINPVQVGASCPRNTALYHYTGGSWQALTPPSHPPANEICGITTSFSPFALFGSLTAQTINFPAIANQTLPAGPVTVSASASSGLAVVFSSFTTTVCTVSGNIVTLLMGGTCTIAADQGGNATYAAAPEVTQSFNVLGSQTINFPTIPTQPVNEGSYTLSATDSAGLAITYNSSTPSVCTVSGTTVTLVATGACSITASQAGNGSYAPTSTTDTFSVELGQTITFPTISNPSTSSSPLALAATASSGLAVSYLATPSSVCSVSGSTLTLVAAGLCTVMASQAGNATYAPAQAQTQMFSVTAGSGGGGPGGGSGGGSTDGPLPLWALYALGAGLVGIASRRLKKAA
ncbi:MAG: kelch repeat-containing protein [Steroidobacteraceae bacterium]